MGLAEELAALGAAGELGRLASQAAGTGGCAAPVRLVGCVDHVDAGTGEMRRAYSTLDPPGEPVGAVGVGGRAVPVGDGAPDRAAGTRHAPGM